jgi:hypothetical protein
LTFFKSPRIGKELDFLTNISEKIEKKLSSSDKTKFDNLTLEELQDLSKICKLANFMLAKYEDKKEVRSIMQYFVSTIQESAQSIEKIDDEVSELIISAEDSISKIKEIHTNISEKYDVVNPKSYDESPELNEGTCETCPEIDASNSSINFTKIAIEINSQEYQRNSSKKDIQVV